MIWRRPTSCSARLALVIGFLVVLVCLDAPRSADKTSQGEGSPSRVAPPVGLRAADVLARLKEGNARFVVDDLATRATYPDQRRRLAKGQEPLAVVLTCAD